MSQFVQLGEEGKMALSQTAPSVGAADPQQGAGFGPWPQHSLLVVDDEEGMRSFLSRALSSRCGLAAVASNVEEAALLVERYHFDVIVLDIVLPGRSGVEWLVDLRASGFPGDVILITAFADMETAIKALRAGASDFILKPFRLDQILSAIQRCFERSRLARENYLLKREVRERAAVDGLIGVSEAIRTLAAMIQRIAPMPSTVLIEGESGTGKEVAARALHNLSMRSGRAFVPVNCAAIPGSLIESELFGHVKGAFTDARADRNGLFYYAHGGTLFLDEIGDLPLTMQTKLLRVLEERRIRPVGSEREVPVDVRIVAASNRSLAAEVAAGRFRKDLFYRLDVVNLVIPPLRERPEDVPVLARHFAAQLAQQLGVPAVAVTVDVAQRLMGYSWPGNARELRNLVERALILGYFPTAGAPAADSTAPVAELFPDMPLEYTLDQVEKEHILRVLASVQGNKSEAARRLGVSRKTLERKCAIWDTERREP
jgi:DNA-binding NtrC family response regulator